MPIARQTGIDMRGSVQYHLLHSDCSPDSCLRNVENLAAAGWTGVGALLLWAVATLLLVIIALAEKEVKPIHFGPAPGEQGRSGFAAFANSCAVISTLTTAFSCQAAGMYAVGCLNSLLLLCAVQRLRNEIGLLSSALHCTA